jgi:hypothetical protein
MTFIDGGVFCNNPSEQIYSEIRAVYGKGPDLILSIGTGIKDEDSQPSEGSDDAPETTNTHRNTRHRYFDHARSLFSTARGLAHIVAESEGTHTKLQDHLHAARVAGGTYPMYFRFNVPGIASDIELDQWEASRESGLPNGERTLQYLQTVTEEYLEDPDVSNRLQECAVELVRVRRERAETERWERFATHTVYQCPLKDQCGSPQFSSREKLRMHASERHELVPKVTIGDQHICLIDHCMETPRLHNHDNEFLKHLKEPDHDMKNATPMTTSQLEDWLDLGRQTEDMVLKRLKQDRGPLGSKTRRGRRSTFGRKRARSTTSERDTSMSE